MTATLRRKFASIDDIKRANAQAGQHFFSPSTMRFFDSRVLDTLYGPEGSIFVTSEKNPFGDPRAYSVRQIDADGHVNTMGEFQGYSTIKQAEKAARAYANQ